MLITNTCHENICPRFNSMVTSQCVSQVQREHTLSVGQSQGQSTASSRTGGVVAVSYTHLDVYKRQIYDGL